ncbi:g12070 [Coccomyxa viridis]|uniref:Mitochondrial import inner membrane translocase subunit n=1 Tax=Coccomyxa viridis TaxID=1274662 RepID=A0ABP1G9F0_9CHLO
MSRPDENQVMNQVQSELSMAYLQEFYTTVRDKCFEKCVTKPSSSLGSSEQQCLARCCDRYAEATQVVMRSVLEQSGLGD